MRLNITIKILNKLAFLLLFLLQTYNGKVNAQLITIKSNVDEQVRKNSSIFKYFNGEYDFILAYNSYGWNINPTNDFHILALKKHTWKKITCSYAKSDFDYSSKPNIITSAIKRKRVEELMNTLNEQQFWTLNNDSLHIYEQKPKSLAINSVVNDTLRIIAPIIKRFTLVDGISYEIQIMTRSNYRVYRAYAPEEYLKFFPEIKTTRRFIISRNALEKALFD